MFSFETTRLSFENYRPENHDDLISLFTDNLVMKHVGQGQMSIDEAELLWKRLLETFYPNGKRTIWAVFARGDARYIGHAALRPRPEKREEWEISYMLKPPEWGKGFATEIAEELIKFGFEKLGLNEIYATIDDDNLASIKVVTKAGMKFRCHEFDELGRFSVYGVLRP